MKEVKVFRDENTGQVVIVTDNGIEFQFKLRITHSSDDDKLIDLIKLGLGIFDNEVNDNE